MEEVKPVLTFFLNGRKCVIENPNPDQTLLEYIRSTGLTGTKLACGEGGCGACTGLNYFYIFLFCCIYNEIYFG